MDTETSTVETAPETATTPSKRAYAGKDEMQRGQDAILATLRSDAGLSKAEILAALSEADRLLVTRNWNLRIAKLCETGFVVAQGQKVAKRYFKAAAA